MILKIKFQSATKYKLKYIHFLSRNCSISLRKMNEHSSPSAIIKILQELFTYAVASRAILTATTITTYIPEKKKEI